MGEVSEGAPAYHRQISEAQTTIEGRLFHFIANAALEDDKVGLPDDCCSQGLGIFVVDAIICEDQNVYQHAGNDQAPRLPLR